MISRINTMPLAIAVMLSTALSLMNAADANGKHLFILSGQSNMNHLNPNESFIPSLEKALGKGNVVVVKDAQDAQPIRRWHRAWKPASGEQPQGNGDLYNRLWGKVKNALEGQQFTTVTFVWMQGERDATEKHGEVYAESLKGLAQQLADDLKRKDLNVVVGRLNDHAMNNKSKPHWTMVRDAQLQAVKDMPRADWVDTDDLNGSNNGIHATADGYKILGERFAEKALKLILEKK